MLDIKFVRENPDTVKENIKKKFQDEKLPLVDEVVDLDVKYRAAMTEANELRASRNALSKKVGQLMGQAKKDPSKLAEAEEAKAQVKANADRLAELETLHDELAVRIRKIMLTIPNIMTPPFPSARTIRQTSRSSASASLPFPISTFPTTPRSWRASTALTWTRPAAFPAADFTISWAILRACTRQ